MSSDFDLLSSCSASSRDIANANWSCKFHVSILVSAVTRVCSNLKLFFSCCLRPGGLDLWISDLKVRGTVWRRMDGTRRRRGRHAVALAATCILHEEKQIFE